MIRNYFISIMIFTFLFIFNYQYTIAREPDTLSNNVNTGQIQTKDNSNLIVYITKTGKKYHQEDCRYLSKSKIPKKLEDIISAYDPCSVCDPPLLGVESVQGDKDKEESKSKETYKSTDKKSVATQCLGTTKKGKRCKRKTKDPSGYCWQHR